MIPFGDRGTIHVTLRIVSRWGILEATNGALMGPKRIYVSAPDVVATDTLRGDGWTLELAEGWTMQQGEREGDFVLVKSR